MDNGRAQEIFTQSAGKAVETLTVWTDANQRVLRELAELSVMRTAPTKPAKT